jgi:hypothetical protein
MKGSQLEWNLVDTNWFWMKSHSLMYLKAKVDFVVGLGPYWLKH